MRRLILDTDGGVDDAQALLMLLANGRAPAAITTVFGNVPLAQATANILATLKVAGAGIPVHAGAAGPLVGEAVEATAIHGADGLGGAPRPADIPAPASADGVGFLVAALREAAAFGERVDLMFIGPLTNLALALRLEPAIAAGVGQLVMMGGTMHGRGNVTPAAEFNIYADPEAAAAVFAAGLDIVMVPWETCTAHRLTSSELDALFAALPDTPYRTFGEALARHARKTNMGYGNGDIMRFVDPLAAAVAIAPDIAIETFAASVAVALAPGLTRGMTVIDPSGRLGPKTVTIVEAAAPERLVALYRRSLG